ncbi:pyridoxal-phosphate dependent enzyme [Kitasatospora sp. NPDC096077]|uniref:pyridoxal-phosphate dependent enzyme n=1 Tax=Kitasatospora sp. NPDC096077 TaxID=3155544 RepID=UPI003325F2A5
MEIYTQDRVVRRYAAHLPADPALLRRAALREGGRIVQLPPQREVLIDVLDLSTTNTTGTFKAWLVCLAVAQCLRREQPLVLAQSSGNTANALAAYAVHTGLRAVLLHPPASRRRIAPDLADSGAVRFVEVDAPEQRIKAVLAECTAALHLPAAPTPADQDEANKLRAFLLRDAGRELGRRWDWHVQALSSGYGPIGYYQGLRELRREPGGAVALPRFLGVQQEAVAPFVHALGLDDDRAARAPEDHGRAPEPELLEPTLFRRSLTEELVARMRRLCAESRGTVRALANSRYLQLEPRAVTLLRDAGVPVAPGADGVPHERAGLYALAGALDAIEQGLIRPGERVLAVYTGGAAPAPPRPYHPHFRARPEEAAEVVAHAVAELRR